MSDATFTPGPWIRHGARLKWRSASSDQMLDSHAVGPDGDAVALVFYAPKYHAEQWANAGLIAAAPDLLSALQALADASDRVGIAHFDTDDMSEEVEAMQSATLKAREAIARAGVRS